MLAGFLQACLVFQYARSWPSCCCVPLAALSSSCMVFCIGTMSQVAVVPNSELGEPPVELGQPYLQFRQRVSAWEHMVHLSDMLPHQLVS